MCKALHEAMFWKKCILEDFVHEYMLRERYQFGMLLGMSLRCGLSCIFDIYIVIQLRAVLIFNLF